MTPGAMTSDPALPVDPTAGPARAAESSLSRGTRGATCGKRRARLPVVGNGANQRISRFRPIPANPENCQAVIRAWFHGGAFSVACPIHP